MPCKRWQLGPADGDVKVYSNGGTDTATSSSVVWEQQASKLRDRHKAVSGKLQSCSRVRNDAGRFQLNIDETRSRRSALCA